MKSILFIRLALLCFSLPAFVWVIASNPPKPQPYKTKPIVLSDAKPAPAVNTINSKSPVFTSISENMVMVNGGTYTMGCTDGQGNCNTDEKPAHPVTLSGFKISKYEVTQAQWQLVMGSNPSGFKDCDSCPVEQVSWSEIKEFLSKLNSVTGKTFRLPTEAEWEYAARGGSQGKGYLYCGGNDPGNVAWNVTSSESKTHPVGQKQPNELGLYDMSGNVWEFCTDWYGANFYSISQPVSPRGAGGGQYRVVRGGSWSSTADHCRAAVRSKFTPDSRSRNNSVGFRLVQD